MIASIAIDGAERAANRRGVNIVVYNERTNTIVDSTVFDTFVSTEREAGYLPELLEEESSWKPFAELSANLQKLYLYDYRCAQERKIEQSLWGDRAGSFDGEMEGFFALLEAFEDDANVSAYITTKGDISGILSSESRERLESAGLSELADFEAGDAYVGVMRNGAARLEKRRGGIARAEYGNAKLCSGGIDPDAESYIMTDNSRKDAAEEGINIVLYDRELKMVIYAGSFK